MSKLDALKYLVDIKECILSIDEHLGEKKSFDVFVSNKTIRRAVERELKIIGEAVNKLLKIEPEIEISYAQTIVDLRNKVIHAYDTVDYNLLWRIIQKDMPVLAQEVKQLLSKLEN